MKEIKAYVRKEKAENIIRELENAGVPGMTIIDVNAIAEWADANNYSYSIEFVQKYSTVVKIELICDDDQVDELSNIIAKYGKTGNSGDGWIFVSEISKAIKIKSFNE